MDLTQFENDDSIYRLALDLAPAAIVAVDHMGRIVLVNRESERLFGYTRQQLIGRPVEQLVPDRYRSTHPGRREAFLSEPEARPMGRGRELHALRRDGTEVPVEIGLNPIETDGGPLVVTSIVDRTEQKRADARFRAVVESAPSGMLMVDAQGVIVLANREVARTFGYDEDELHGLPIERLVPNRFESGHPAHRERYLVSPEARRMGTGRELYGLRKDGTEIPVEVGLTPITTGEGTFVLASVVDITLRRSMENQLREAQRLETVGVLASGIAHDFNNVLLAILGYAELAVDDPTIDSRVRDDLRQIVRAAERGRQVVDRMLEVGRRKRTSPQAIDLRDPVVEAVELLQASALKSVEVRRDLDDATPQVFCDTTQIHQIVMNLASNAARAMSRSRGVLAISLAPVTVAEGDAHGSANLKPGHYARLTVSDNGEGMTEDTLERAFEPFYTAGAQGQGTGLGLWLVREIVQSLRGVITVDTRPGAGTTFNIYFPAIDTTAAEAATDAAAEPDEAGVNGRPHIVYVEDEEPLAELGRRRLEAAGFRVSIFTSSVDALEQLRSDPEGFELLVTDNTMPRLSGLELAAEVVRLRPGLPVLMVSGLARMNVDELPDFITRVLQKPHSMAELVTCVRELIGNGEAAG